MRRATFVAMLLSVGLLTVSARAGGNSSLSLMPLPKEMLGTVAITLPLDPDSGVQTNAKAASDSTSHVTKAALDRLGRITGYELDYDDAAGHAIAAGQGLLEVSTEVDRYTSAAAARRALDFWRKDDANVAAFRKAGMSVSESFFAPPRSLGASFGMTAKIRLPGKPPLYGVDLQFVSGALVADVSVTAADSASRRGYAQGLAAKLAGRIRDVQLGRVKGPPVTLPAKLKAGPPPNGPPLDGLALTPNDVGGGKVATQGYKLDRDLSPISEYVRTISPAGPFPILTEQVMLFHSPTEASFTFSGLSTTFASKDLLTLAGPLPNVVSFTPERVPVHGKDEAAASRAKVVLKGGVTVNEGFVLVRLKSTVELIVVGVPATAPITNVELQRVTDATITRATLGLHG